jgi:hypothetical protein
MEDLSSAAIEAILCDTLPDECELAGEAHVQNVAEVSARGESVMLQPPSRTGLRTSPEAAMLAVAAAANFIKACVNIYFTLRKAKKVAPTRSPIGPLRIPAQSPKTLRCLRGLPLLGDGLSVFLVVRAGSAQTTPETALSSCS